MNKTIVTGATGFLGLQIIKELVRQKTDVLAFVFRGESTGSLEKLGVPFVFGDITEKNCLDGIVQEGDRVIHSAGFVSIARHDREKVWEVNYQGTKNVLESSIKNRAKSFVYVSSVHAFPVWNGTICEKDFAPPIDLRKKKDAYEMSKEKASELVIKNNGNGISTSVIFPSGLVGPGDEKDGEVTTFINTILRKKFRFYVSGGYEFCDVRDVAKATILAIDRPGEIYIVSSGFISIKEIIEIVQEAAGFHQHLFRVPRFLAWILAFFASPFQHLRKRKPLLTFYSLRVTASTPFFLTTKAKNELNFSATPLATSLKEETAYLLRLNQE